MRTYTISEAAEVTGLSRKAIARRIERGSLRSLVRNGRRRIPRSELVRAGLLAEDADAAPDLDPSALLLPRPVPGGDLEPAGRAEDLLVALVRELLDRVEKQASEVAQMRALTAQAESLRLTNELADLRVRMAELERERPGADAPPPQGDFSRRISELSKQVEELAKREIWLPPQAAARQPAATAPLRAPAAAAPPHAAAAPAGQVAAQAYPPPRRLGRTTRFVLEAAFIVAVAAGAWQADLGAPLVAAIMAAAWVIVAVIEAVSFRRGA
ncbi:MAG TPA: helix-turn-helix domain-containing protein [Gaiellaceae bacterium]|nr:helix-turn-helix domain-containing protein [Gaiellaceae bacterium]